LSANARVALFGPDVLGVKVTMMRQLLLAGRLKPLQPSFMITKSELFGPVILAAMPVRGAFPALVAVTMAEVLLKMIWLPKSIVAGDNATHDTAQVPKNIYRIAIADLQRIRRRPSHCRTKLHRNSAGAPCRNGYAAGIRADTENLTAHESD
jgi:hypothetical protein